MKLVLCYKAICYIYPMIQQILLYKVNSWSEFNLFLIQSRFIIVFLLSHPLNGQVELIELHIYSFLLRSFIIPLKLDIIMFRQCVNLSRFWNRCHSDGHTHHFTSIFKIREQLLYLNLSYKYYKSESLDVCCSITLT